MLDDRQPETGAAWPGSRLIDSIETFEHAAEIIRRDAVPGVGDGQLKAAVEQLGTHVDRAALRRVVDRVLDQVPRNVVELRRVSREPPCRRPDLDLDGLLL